MENESTTPQKTASLDAAWDLILALDLPAPVLRELMAARLEALDAAYAPAPQETARAA